MRLFCAISVVLLLAVQSPAAERKTADSSGIESLGQELLDDLNPDVFEQPEAQPLNRTNPSKNSPRVPDPREPRFDDLGEDIGQPSGPLSLAHVGQGMQHAGSLLEAKIAGADISAVQQAGAVQQQVVDQLDKLIAELSKQCQGGQCQPSDQPPKPSQRSQSKPGKSGSAAGRGQTAARDSNARLDRASTQSVGKGEIDALVKDLWGHLPERSREQMLQSFSDEFLPKYELEIEQYYRRLSEENDEKRFH